jgi:NTP pyrophosphatase (non-canonical NTP hydrolase)
MSDTLSLGELRAANASRVKDWHGGPGVQDWSVMEWGCAMAGEAGEACNVAKKIRRRDMKLARRGHEYTDDLKAKLAEECADTLIYLDLLCLHQDIDLAAAVREKFNRISAEFGFPQRL